MKKSHSQKDEPRQGDTETPATPHPEQTETSNEITEVETAPGDESLPDPVEAAVPDKPEDAPADVHTVEAAPTEPAATHDASAASTDVTPAAEQKTATSKQQRFKNLVRRHRVPVLLICLLVILAITSSATWFYQQHVLGAHPVARFAAVVTPFKIVSTVPANGQNGITNAGKVILNFSRPVDASKLDGDFFTSPAVAGTYSQGANSKQAIFTPKQPFTSGTEVKIMVHGEYESQDGAKLGADYSFGFTTATPDDGVIFQHAGDIETLGSAPAGSSQTYSIWAGDQVSTGNTITIYKSTMQQLLESLTYTEKSANGYDYQTFANNSVDTTGLVSVATKTGLKNNDTFQFTPDKGVYVLVATNHGQQVGYDWLVASKFGVIVRQDDQQAVFTVQDYATGAPVTADLVLYHLNNTVQQLAEATVTGMDAIQLPISPSLDVAVATNGDDTAIVPVATYLTQADNRVQKDLGTSYVIYGLTDRPTYNPGDTVQYAGFIRTDNDVAYKLPATGQIELYVAARPDSTHYADTTATVTANGLIKATFVVGSDAIPADQSSQQLYVYNGSATNATDANSPVGAFTVTNGQPSSYALNVQFAKTDYLASDPVAATITGTTTDGTPLAHKSVTVTVYAKTYYENDTAANLTSLGDTGDQITTTPLIVTLDSSGHATVPIDVSKFPAGSSQMATVQASIADPNGITAGGGASTIVHEGDGVLEFGSARTVIPSGGQIIGRVYAKTLNDQPLANALVSYTLSTNQGTNTTQLTSGTVTTDTNGYAEIKQSIGSYPAGTYFTLAAATADTHNNKISANTYYYSQSPDDNTVYSDVQLGDLDIAGAPEETAVGQTLNLSINAPYAVHALVTLERGRIHSYKMVDLSAGMNSYNLPITADLAPSFSLVLSYFENGRYHTEGVSFKVPPLDKQAMIHMTAPSTVQAGQVINVGVKTNDMTGQPLPTSVILGAVSSNVFNLHTQVTPDIFAYLYSARDITTNASSSLVGIGSGGGKCGGGGFDQPALLNPLGTSAAWEPSLTTDNSGSTNTQMQLPKGTWRIYAYTMSSDGLVGSTATTVVAQ